MHLASGPSCDASTASASEMYFSEVKADTMPLTRVTMDRSRSFASPAPMPTCDTGSHANCSADINAASLIMQRQTYQFVQTSLQSCGPEQRAVVPSPKTQEAEIQKLMQ